MSRPPATPLPPLLIKHVPKNIFLIFLSFVTLPFSIGLVCASILYTQWKKATTAQTLSHTCTKAKTVLVTGVSMSKGLSIARCLSLHTAHRVIGADISGLAQARFSSALGKYYTLEQPKEGDATGYIDALLNVLRIEDVDLWISCSSVGAAVEDAEVVSIMEKERRATGKRFGFHAVQFGEEVVRVLHGKDEFISFIEAIGLPTPESHRCESFESAMAVLSPSSASSQDPLSSASLAARPPLSPIHESTNGLDNHQPGKKSFILKPIAVNDHARALMPTLLPLPALSQTTNHIRSLSLSPSNPFQLQQFIHGMEYCTHALVLRNKIAAFTACPSSDMLMHYEPLAPSSPLHTAMLSFTQTVVDALPPLNGGASVSGHLSFDFLAVAGEKGGGWREADVSLYPIECNPRAHTAVTLFRESARMAKAYLSVFDDEVGSKEGHAGGDVVFPEAPFEGVYWLGHDLVTLVVVPVLSFLLGGASLVQVRGSLRVFMHHVVYWREGAFSVWDPVPFLVLYHVYWPWQFLMALLTGRGWSRVNVSTTKVFEC